MSNCQQSQQRLPNKAPTFPSSDMPPFSPPAPHPKTVSWHASSPASKPGNPFPLTAYLKPMLQRPCLPCSQPSPLPGHAVSTNQRWLKDYHSNSPANTSYLSQRKLSLHFYIK